MAERHEGMPREFTHSLVFATVFSAGLPEDSARRLLHTRPTVRIVLAMQPTTAPCKGYSGVGLVPHSRRGGSGSSGFFGGRNGASGRLGFGRGFLGLVIGRQSIGGGVFAFAWFSLALCAFSAAMICS